MSSRFPALGLMGVCACTPWTMAFDACSSSEPPKPAPAAAVKVLETLPHDTDAFTQGLAFDNGALFESTGRYGQSTVREVRLSTGEVIRAQPLASAFFGEGLAVHAGQLFQLTWREGQAFVWNQTGDAFSVQRTLRYSGEGWGLCASDAGLWMSDGSATLTLRDPATFQAQRTLQVRDKGEPVVRLNELECVGEHIYANIWQTRDLVRIRVSDGRVDRRYDLSALDAGTQNPEAVANGVAYRPDNGTFLLTGKLWRHLYVVELGDAP